MRINEHAKTVVIPVRMVNGTFQYFYGGKLPDIKEGAILDLHVPEYAIADTRFLEKLEVGGHQELLPRDAAIFAAIATDQIPDNLQKSALRLADILGEKPDSVTASLVPDSRLVEIVLEEPLFIQLRGTKLGRLKPAKCSIPALNKKAISLNHAYRLISEHFEPGRISHSGNVFQKIVYIADRKNVRLLDDLRSNLEAQNEPKLA